MNPVTILDPSAELSVVSQLEELIVKAFTKGVFYTSDDNIDYDVGTRQYSIKGDIYIGLGNRSGLVGMFGKIRKGEKRVVDTGFPPLDGIIKKYITDDNFVKNAVDSVYKLYEKAYKNANASLQKAQDDNNVDNIKTFKNVVNFLSLLITKAMTAISDATTFLDSLISLCLAKAKEAESKTDNKAKDNSKQSSTTESTSYFDYI